MKHKNIFCNRRVRLAFCFILTTFLVGCYVEPPPGGVVVANPDVEVVGVEGGLIYYPYYGYYYDPGTRVFWYPQGGVWVTGPRPPGVSVDVVFASPHVRMDFRDSPANHHAEVVRRYPRNWRPPRR